MPNQSNGLLRMPVESTVTKPEKRLRLVRLLALVAILGFLATWLAAVPIYIQGIVNDLDSVLALLFEGEFWTPEAVRAAAVGLGVSPALPAWSWLGIEIVSLLGFGISGLFLYWRKPDYFGAYLAAALVLIGTRITGPVSFALAEIIPGWESWLNFLSLLAFLAFASLLYLFPTGRFVPAWSRWLLILTVIYGTVTTFLTIAVGATALDGFVFLGYFAVGIGAQIYRYTRVSDPVKRQQTKWVLASFALFLLFALIPWILAPNIVQQHRPPTPADIAAFLINYLVLTLVTILFVIALAFSILRYRLWDVDLIIRRTLIYGALTVFLVLLYFGSVVLLQTILTAITSQQSPIAIVISTLFIAALFNPLRHRLQDIIDRRFYRQKYDAAQTLAAFANKARDEVDLEQLSAELMRVVHETMQPEQATLWLKPASGNRRDSASKT
jgi:hypothetical protein